MSFILIDRKQNWEDNIDYNHYKDKFLKIQGLQRHLFSIILKQLFFVVNENVPVEL